MHFIINCVDKTDGGLALRMSARPDHQAYLKAHADQVVAAGPTLADDGETMTGSVIIMEFPDRAAAEAFAAGDPYAKAGVFESVTIKAWQKAYPQD